MHKDFWLIWGAFFCSIIIYLLVAYIFIAQMPPPEISTNYIIMVAVITMICTIVSGVSSIIIKVKFISSSIDDGTLDIKSEDGLKKYLTYSIINWALSASIAVFGLIMMVLSGVFYYVLPYSIISIALLIIHKPRF